MFFNFSEKVDKPRKKLDPGNAGIRRYHMFYNADGGLTTAGYVLTAVAVFALLILISTLAGKKKTVNAKQLAFAAGALALAIVTSYIKLFHLPMGGSVTLFSMFFVTLIGYWYGPKIGLVCAFTYSLLQFVQGGGSYIISPLQVALDYLLAFTALGFSGFFSVKKIPCNFPSDFPAVSSLLPLQG